MKQIILRTFLAYVVTLVALVLSAQAANAQAGYTTAYVVSSCGAQTFGLGSWASITQLANGELCTNATGGGGGGGAITAAVGSYAAGAFSAGTGVDGWDLTEGTTADAAYAGSGSASTISALKGIYNAIVANLVALGQAPMASSLPVTIASNQSVGDPCMFQAKSFAPVNLAASGQVITGVAAKKTYICSIHVVSAAAQNIALVEGTGSTCATNVFGLAGGTTAATGWNFSANEGIALGNSQGTVIFGSGDANATAANICLLLSSTGQTSGTIGYVQQ